MIAAWFWRPSEERIISIRSTSEAHKEGSEAAREFSEIERSGRKHQRPQRRRKVAPILLMMLARARVRVRAVRQHHMHNGAPVPRILTSGTSRLSYSIKSGVPTRNHDQILHMMLAYTARAQSVWEHHQHNWWTMSHQCRWLKWCWRRQQSL